MLAGRSSGQFDGLKDDGIVNGDSVSPGLFIVVGDGAMQVAITDVFHHQKIGVTLLKYL